MHGDGIKPDITVAEKHHARLLDLSRLCSRAGRIPTGIDRVELAYLNAFLAGSVPVYGLVQTAWGYLLLDKDGCRSLRDRIEGRLPWGSADLLSRLRFGLTPDRQRSEADLRRIAIARTLPLGLPYMLRRYVPQECRYVNVGHANLSARVLGAVKASLRARVAIMVHDTIPLDFPHYQRAGTVERFRGMLRRVQKHADVVLCNSAQTEGDVMRHLSANGRIPDTVVAHLGLAALAHGLEPVWPTGFDRHRPYFVTVGTIEPRKNHMFLMNLWAEMQATLPEAAVPQLLICGGRGWNNDVMFARLDTDPMMGRHVFELSGQSDDQIAGLLSHAHGALFPSHAEGFGLPPAEALGLGVPVICNSLEIYREILGDYPVYASVQDSYLWKQEIQKLAARQWNGQSRRVSFQPPSWDAHFNKVLSHL